MYFLGCTGFVLLGDGSVVLGWGGGNIGYCVALGVMEDGIDIHVLVLYSLCGFYLFFVQVVIEIFSTN